MLRRLDLVPWSVLIIAALALGLAPFSPMPHLFEKILMLSEGRLARPIDIFDLFMHGGPLIVIGLKLIRSRQK